MNEFGGEGEVSGLPDLEGARAAGRIKSTTATVYAINSPMQSEGFVERHLFMTEDTGSHHTCLAGPDLGTRGTK